MGKILKQFEFYALSLSLIISIFEILRSFFDILFVPFLPLIFFIIVGLSLFISLLLMYRKKEKRKARVLDGYIEDYKFSPKIRRVILFGIIFLFPLFSILIIFINSKNPNYFKNPSLQITTFRSIESESLWVNKYNNRGKINGFELDDIYLINKYRFKPFMDKDDPNYLDDYSHFFDFYEEHGVLDLMNGVFEYLSENSSTSISTFLEKEQIDDPYDFSIYMIDSFWNNASSLEEVKLLIAENIEDNELSANRYIEEFNRDFFRTDNLILEVVLQNNGKKSIVLDGITFEMKNVFLDRCIHAPPFAEKIPYTSSLNVDLVNLSDPKFIEWVERFDQELHKKRKDATFQEFQRIKCYKIYRNKLQNTQISMQPVVIGPGEVARFKIHIQSGLYMDCDLRLIFRNGRSNSLYKSQYYFIDY